MPIPILNYPQPKQLSITDAMREWGDVRDSQINRDEALGDIGRQQKVRDYYAGLNGAQPNVSAVSSIDPKAGIGAAAMNHQQAQMGVEQMQASKQVATHFTHSLKRTAQQLGIQPGTPEYQQLADKVYRSTPIYAQTMKNVAGVNDDPTKPIDWKSAENMSDQTPEEQAQQEIEQATMKEQALYPYKLDYAKAQAGVDMGKIQYQDQLARGREADNFKRSEAAADSRANRDIGKLYNKPLSPSVLKMIQQNTEAAKTGRDTSADIGNFISQIDNKQINFGILSNLGAKAQEEGIFKSTPEGRNFISFQSALQKWVNNTLRMSKGVQTDSDALREKVAQILKARDPEIVRQRLIELQADVNRLADNAEMQNDELYGEYHRQAPSLPESKGVYNQPPTQIFNARPPNKPGFRILHNPQTGEYMYKPEGG